MPLVSKSFSIDIIPGKTPPTIHVSEKDIGRTYFVEILNDGEHFSIPSNTTAKVEGTIGPYGFSENADVINDSIIFVLKRNMTAIRGKVWTKIKLSNNGDIVSTCAFWLDVDKAGAVEGQYIDPDVTPDPGGGGISLEGFVQYNVVQYLTDAEKARARQNIGITAVLPVATSSDNGKVLGIVNGQWAIKEDETGGGEVPVRELPAVTSADNGKVLGVVNGQWAIKEDETGESGDSLPAVTSADNGKVLGVVNGEWAVKEDEDTDDELPAVTADDNGKVLGVVNGRWAVKEDDTAGNDIFRTVFTSKRTDNQRTIHNGYNVAVNGQVIADLVNENLGGCQLIEIDTVDGNDAIYDIDMITDNNVSFYRIADGKRYVITIPLDSHIATYSVSDLVDVSNLEVFEVTIDKPVSGVTTYSATYSQIAAAITAGKIVKFIYEDRQSGHSYHSYDYSLKYNANAVRGFEVKFLNDIDSDSESVYAARFNYDNTYSLNEITLDADGGSSGTDKFFAYFGIDNNGYGCNITDRDGHDIQGCVIKNLIETTHGGCILVVVDRSDSNHKVIYDLDEYSIGNTQDIIFYRIADGNRSTVTIPANSNRGTFASEPLASVSGAIVYNASQSLTDSEKRVARRNVGLNGYAIGLRHKLYSGSETAGSFYAILADGTVSSSPLTFSDIWSAYYSNDKCYIFAYDDNYDVYKLKHIGDSSIVLNRVDGSTEYLITMSLMSGETPSTAMNTSANKSSVPIGEGGGSTPETFLISLSYNSSTDTWTCNKTAAEILANMANSMVYYQGYRYYVTSMFNTGGSSATIYYERQEVGSSDGIEEFRFVIQNDVVTIKRYTTPLNLFEIPIVYVTPANGDPYWDIDGILAGTIYNNYKDCVLVTGNKRIHIVKSFRSEDPQDKYVELIGVEPASDGSDLTIWKLVAEGNSNQHASISTYTFDGGSGNPFIINVIRSGNNYSTNAKASDIVAALPNVLLSWSSDIYTIDGYDTDEGFVNSAVFTKKKFNDGVIESTDTFFVVQEDSSVDAVSVYKRSESNSYYYISNGIVKDSVTNNAVTGESINATFGVSGKEPVIDEGTSYFEHIIYHFYRYGSNGIYFRSLDGNYEIYIPWLQSSITKSRFGYNTPYRLRAQWDNSQNKYILQRFEEGQWKSARYVDVAEHRESLWLGQRLPVDRVEFTEGFVTAYFYDVQLSSSGFSIIEWVIDAYGTDEIVVTRNVINNIQRTVYYAVTLNANGTVNTRSNDLDVATVSARMSNPAFADYLLITWGSTLFTARATEQAANGDIKFICDAEHDGIQRHMVFTLDGDNILTTTTIETYSLRPVTVWEVADVSQGLLARNTNISANLNWHLTNLNLAPFKRIKIYSKAGRKTGATAQDSSITPASIIEMSLDDRAMENVSQNVFIGSSVVQNPNDSNRLGLLTCAVSGDKTKFAVVRSTTLYGTAATSNTDAYTYVFKIEGCYD